ncbi:MAG: TonB-dependent receptor [Gammaproteobacteria bacterium]|nr:TonB-dependent receptor [Gammaproteobacteria bacterium]
MKRCWMLMVPAATLACPLHAQEPQAALLPGVEVTATRVPELVDQVPASVRVIGGDELRARGATDLRTALALVAGVDAPSGGDAGPAGAVPSLWGLHEFDAFLLVVDGVPYGGAFNPAIPTLNLTDVERIEVLKGAAPVVYGATAFVGVIQVIHYPAGHAANRVQAGYGSYGSLRASASSALPAIGDWRQSLAISGQRHQFSDPREEINNGKFLYRGAGALFGGDLRLDAAVTLQRQAPNSPIVRQGAALVTSFGANVNPDANFNPADARIDEHRYQIVLDYRHHTPLGVWDTQASYTHANAVDVRGFLRPDFNDPAAEPDPAGDNADYQNQNRGILDTYLNSSIASTLAHGGRLGDIELLWGADWLYGSGRQQSANGAYCAGGTAFGCALDQAAAVPPPTTARPIDEINGLRDRRSFLGQYAQLDWKPAARWDLNGGLRLNETHERNAISHLDTADAGANFSDVASKNKVRLSGSFGVSYRAWSDGADQAVVYADYRNSFKPAAIDFGPDVPTPPVLEPETARSYEIGVKGRLAGGRLDYEAEAFFLHFNNLVVSATDAGGNPLLENAGSELLRGIELSARYRLYRNLQLAANYSYHLARYGRFISLADGTPRNFSGNRLELSPRVLTSAGLIYAPEQGPNGSLTVAYVGNRLLDKANTASTGGYATIDATVGWRWRNFGIRGQAYNLSDRRPPVTESEFGDSSYYLLAGRSLWVDLSWDFGVAG